MTPEQKAWIDNASIYELLEKWRFAAIGDPYFQGECGDYYSKVMTKKRSEDNDAYVAASKSIGWK